jgi:hypothetical protein
VAGEEQVLNDDMHRSTDPGVNILIVSSEICPTYSTARLPSSSVLFSLIQYIIQEVKFHHLPCPSPNSLLSPVPRVLKTAVDHASRVMHSWLIELVPTFLPPVIVELVYKIAEVASFFGQVKQGTRSREPRLIFVCEQQAK